MKVATMLETMGRTPVVEISKKMNGTAAGPEKGQKPVNMSE